MKKYSQKILQLIDLAGKMNNLLIYDVEFKPHILKIYITNKTDSVDLSVCEKFMKSLLFLFESEGMENIECEVSSPGLERKLKKDWHFMSAVGKEVQVHTSQPVVCYDEKSERKVQTTVLKGQLCSCRDNIVSLNDGFLNWTIPMNVIKKAHVVFEGTK